MSKIKDLITEVQKELLVQGINPGKVDGDMGPLTYKALLAYQKRGERPTTPQVVKKVTSHAQPAWRLANSLVTLRAQLNAAHPRRNRKSDGTIGDTAHLKRASDHNPQSGTGVVTAMDITHDPSNGLDCNQLAEAIKGDLRVKYVIWNSRIYERHTEWKPYRGANPHIKHMHISVMANEQLADNDAQWEILNE